MNSLTKKDEVLGVLRAGGWIAAPGRPGHAHGLVYLFDVAGNEVKAWQTAIVSNLVHCVQGTDGLWRWRA